MKLRLFLIYISNFKLLKKNKIKHKKIMYVNFTLISAAKKDSKKSDTINVFTISLLGTTASFDLLKFFIFPRL